MDVAPLVLEERNKTSFYQHFAPLALPKNASNFLYQHLAPLALPKHSYYFSGLRTRLLMFRTFGAPFTKNNIFLPTCHTFGAQQNFLQYYATNISRLWRSPNILLIFPGASHPAIDVSHLRCSPKTHQIFSTNISQLQRSRNII